LCCVQIDVSNPLCDDPRVGFFKLNQSTGLYQWISDITCHSGQTISQIICPAVGETTIITRIYFYDKGTNYSACSGGSSNWVENYNQFTDTTDISDCCPCPSSRDSWLNFIVQKDRNCINDGCKVTFLDFNFPEEITCYNHYIIEYPNQTMSSMKDITSEPITGTSFCVGNNSNSTVKVYLFKSSSINFDSTCMIEKPIICDSTVYNPEDSTAQSCLIDCPLNPWIGPRWATLTLQPSYCIVRVQYQFRFGCSPNYYQDFQILRIVTYENCSGMTDLEIFQKTTIALIEADPMGFVPLPGDTGCNDQWRLSVKSCWKTDLFFDMSGSHYSLHMCDSATCCVQKFRVCRPPLSITKLGTEVVYGTPNCISIEPQIIDDPNSPFRFICHTTCEWLDIEFGNPPPPIMNINNFEVFQDLSDVIKNLQTTNNDKLKIEIFNVMGYQVFCKEFPGSDKLNNNNLSTLINCKGIYLYNIHKNGIIIKTGKIIK